ncbi:hypothetical protein D0T49_07245 [Paludibacter sp. 221]|uniref:FISUMP domain-containing protein n=1 Tax=Paludibacter sp. 221 TaxID=2302939 RepID=UPI0013D6BEB9|nr:FISUMP domain-containing protein [Paludibacter sp. 221]NDV46841.1 hypothetical protein [Paludibacter sp. 221]
MNRKQSIRQTLVLFCLFQFSFFIFSATAQVTIGADKAPESFSLLEVTGTTGGLRLPQLTTDQRNKLSVSGKDLAKGLTIYNTDINCTETWNGSKWIANCGDLQNALRITTQPRAFNWRETETAGDMSGIGGKSATISVTATGIAPLTYQWYEVTANTNAAPAPITGETAATFTPDLSKLGMRRYYCQVTDANGNSINSDIAEVAVGCGAKTVAGGWSTFMCYNLGATVTTIADQKSTSSVVYSFSGNETSDAQKASPVYGDLYQWGRTRDGHEKRTSGVSDVVVADVTTGGTTTNGETTGGITTFIKAPSYPYNWVDVSKAPTADLNWGNQKNSTYDPCPAGWRVPAQSDWSDIFRGGSAPGAKATAVANTWVWNDAANGTAGYEIKPDGETTTLFLPVAGYRHFSNGELYYVGSSGFYWSGSVYSYASFLLDFNDSNVYPAYLLNRAYGFSVRCIAEL